jgi:hypothetical protein
MHTYNGFLSEWTSSDFLETGFLSECSSSGFLNVAVFENSVRLSESSACLRSIFPSTLGSGSFGVAFFPACAGCVGFVFCKSSNDVPGDFGICVGFVFFKPSNDVPREFSFVFESERGFSSCSNDVPGETRAC